MDYNSGKLKCKQCGLNKMNIYENWLNKKIYINNSLETQWIFYNRNSISEEKKFSCNDCYKECYSKSRKVCRKLSDLGAKIDICCVINIIIGFIYLLIIFLVFFIYIILYGLIYILIFFWIDICKCLCCRKTTYFVDYLYIENHNMYKGNIMAGGKINKYDIWNHHARTILNKKPEEIFICIKCNYHSDSFMDFIPNISKNISIIFRFCDDQAINNSIVGKLTDKFENFEKKLIEKNPSLKNKKLFYLFKGQAITDKHITLEQLNIKNLDIVLFKENELI